MTLITSIILALCLNRIVRGSAFFRSLVVMPWAVPLILSGFLWAWNEFFAPYLFLHYDELKPITVGLYYFVGDELTYWNRMSAAGIYAVVPSLLFFLLAQRYIVRGLTAGALKY
jgi:ABC-type glycerol-3-phosphate transport system permease component